MPWTKSSAPFKRRQQKSPYSKCCFISDSSAYLEISLTNKVRFTYMEKVISNKIHIGEYEEFMNSENSDQIILFVVHLGGMPSHAVHRQ